MPSLIFSYTFSAHEGTAHKHPPAVSRHIFPRVTYALVRSPCKNAPFLALGHFFAVLFSETTKRCGSAVRFTAASRRRLIRLRSNGNVVIVTSPHGFYSANIKRSKTALLQA